MSKTLAVIQASRGAGPADPKIFRRIRGKSLFEWLIRRATDCQQLDGAVVVLGGGADDDQIRELVPSDVPIFAGAERDSLSRVCAAVRAFRATAIVRVCADNPFADPTLIDRLVSTAALHSECDYISYCSNDGRPAILSHIGVFAEWCSAAALEHANRKAVQLADRVDATRFLYSHPELFHVRFVPCPAGLDQIDMRLSVHHEEDWEHTQVILETLGPEEMDWQHIAGVLNAQRAARQKASVLNA
jgi:spore coat polysaccharide biosynthesis protein SpsF